MEKREPIGLWQQTITWYMVDGKLIIIPALGHQNKGKSSFTASGLFVLTLSCPRGSPLTSKIVCVRQSKIYKCPEHSFGREGVNRDIVFDVVNPFLSKRFPIDE